MNDEPLRRRALDVLGPYGDPLAREALEAGGVEVEHAVATWESSHGTVQAHRVVLVLPAEVHARVSASPAAHDALSAALASALVAWDPAGRTTLYDLRLRVGAPDRSGGAGPYR